MIKLSVNDNSKIQSIGELIYEDKVNEIGESDFELLKRFYGKDKRLNIDKEKTLQSSEPANFLGQRGESIAREAKLSQSSESA